MVKVVLQGFSSSTFDVSSLGQEDAEVLGASSVGDNCCLQELKLVKDEEQLNDEMKDNEEK